MSDIEAVIVHEDSMVTFLASLGINRPERKGPCPWCGSEWPYCNYVGIVDKAPCSAERNET
jgi:hypothetical protein